MCAFKNVIKRIDAFKNTQSIVPQINSGTKGAQLGILFVQRNIPAILT